MRVNEMSDKPTKPKQRAFSSTGTATLYAIVPEVSHKLVGDVGWQALAEGMGREGMFQTGTDGAWDVTDSTSSADTRAPHERTAATTQQYDELEALISALSDPLMVAARAVDPWHSGKVKQPARDAALREIRIRGQAVLDKLVFNFENPAYGKALVKYMRRVKNFRKLLQSFVDASDWEAFETAYGKASSKSKSAWHKFREYSQEALSVVRAVDVEAEHKMTIAGFNVALLTAPSEDWGSESVGKLEWVLRESNKLMSKHGFAQAASGSVLAYPTKYLPMSSGSGPGVLAKYRLGGVVWVAVGRDPKETLKTFVHELGHKVYFEVMGTAGRSAWDKFYNMHQDAPDVGAILSDWQRYVAAASNEVDAARRAHLPFYYTNLRKRDPELASWVKIIDSKFDLDEGEKLDRYDRPAKSSRAALQELESRKGEIKVFLYPVTAYSAVSSEELFAEVFAHYIVYGPRTIQGIVRDQFHRALPGVRGASQREDMEGTESEVIEVPQDEVETEGAWAELAGALSPTMQERLAKETPKEDQIIASTSDWLRLADTAHAKSIALMQFLAKTAQRVGVGEHVYVVGGAVRNFIIDRPIKDIDVVIDAVALGGKKDSDWFAEYLARAIPTSTDITTNQYGVAILTVKGSWELDGHDMKGEVIEIANARKESYGGEAGKGYKPSEVEPATIEEDVYRREFTFNCMAGDTLIPTGCGMRDLQDRVLRCPRDPDVVLSDDPTRLMRVIKFVAKYGFDIPSDVAASIRKNAPAMKRAPWEAIANILVENVLNEPTAREALKLMQKLGLLDVVSEMVREQKPFATYLSKQLRNRNVQLLLDLMDIGLDVKSPVSFLDRAQQQRLRELTTGMHEEDAQAYLTKLTKPPIDNKALIDQFSIPPHGRGTLAPTARVLILKDPSLADNPRALMQAMERELSRQFRATMATAEVGQHYGATDQSDWSRLAKGDLIPGGVGDKAHPSDVDPEQLAKGIKVEMEHTGDKSVAQEIALDHLSEPGNSNYYGRLETIEKHGSRTAAETGNGEKVGLFIRVPAELASEFPPPTAEDTSPRHITFLYVGQIPAERRDEFLAIVADHVEGFGAFDAAFDGLDSFVQPSDDRRVFFVRAKFDRDVGSLRDRLSGALTDAGFEVLNKFPLAYSPHATLAYVEGIDSKYRGPVPDGSWRVTAMEVWGLPQVEQIKLGSLHVCKLQVRTKSASVKLLPVHNPLYNMREMVKQILLLEDHLMHPRKRCMDCIRKHLLTIEALAEEAVTLSTDDLDPKWAIGAEMLAEVARMAQVNIERGEDLMVIAQGWRKTRKTLVDTLYKEGSPVIDMIDMTDEEAAVYREDATSRASRPKTASVQPVFDITSRWASADATDQDEWAHFASSPLKLLPDYGTSNAATPRGDEEGDEEDDEANLNDNIQAAWQQAFVDSDEWDRTAAGKFKDKKEVPKADGSGKTTVYEYSDRQVALRNSEKAKRVEKLRGSLSKLRKQFTKDLGSKDPSTRLTALAVALIDATYERVGNDGSAEKGHFGVTGWTVDHVTFKGSKAHFEYVGKSGVKQKKVVDDPKIVSALKAATDSKAKGDKVLCDGDECTITASDVNAYLKPFDVTAKDLRGLHANEEMKTQLRAVREKGSELPTNQKEKKAQLKKEFTTALETTAGIVGHEPSTLKSQYLVGSIEDEYLKHGTVSEELHKKKGGLAAVRRVWAFYYGADRGPQIKTSAFDVLAHCPSCQGILHDGPRYFLACSDCGYNVDFPRRVERVSRDQSWVGLADDDLRLAALDAQEARASKWCAKFLGIVATKSDSEREEDEVRKLVKKDPKKKPPRMDLRNQKIKVEDPDLEPDEQDRKDRSRNHKDIGASINASMLLARLPRVWEVEQEEDGVIDQEGDGPDNPLQDFPSDTRMGLTAAYGPTDIEWLRFAEDRNPGDTWESNGKFYGKNKERTQSFSTMDAAKTFASGGGDDPDGGGGGGSGEDGELEKAPALPDAFAKQYPDLDPVLMKDFVDNLDPDMTDKELLRALEEDFLRGLPEGTKDLPDWVDDMTPKDLGKLVDEMSGGARQKRKEEKKQENAKKKLQNRAKTDPTVLGSQPISDDIKEVPGLTAKDYSERSTEALKHYATAKPEVRREAIATLRTEMAKAPANSPRAAESQAIMNGIALAAHVADDEPIPGIPSPPPKLRALQKAMVKADKGSAVMDTAGDFTAVDSRAAMSDALDNMTDEELVDYAKDDPGMASLAEMLTDDEIPEAGKRLTRRMMQKFTVMQTSMLIPALRESQGKGVEDTSPDQLVANAMSDADAEMAMGILNAHLPKTEDADNPDDPGVLGAVSDMANYLLSKFDDKLSKGKSMYRSVLRAVAKGDGKAMDAKWEKAEPEEGGSAPADGTYERYVYDKKQEGEKPLSKDDWESRNSDAPSDQADQADQAEIDLDQAETDPEKSSKTSSLWADHYGLAPWPAF